MGEVDLEKLVTAELLKRRRFHASVRNILFNELGLTKTSVDDMLRKIVQEQVKALVSNTEGLYGFIEKRVLSSALRYNTTLSKLMDDAIRKVMYAKVDAFLKDRLDVRVIVRDATGKKPARKSPTKGQSRAGNTRKRTGVG